jgi:hypothetical protein
MREPAFAGAEPVIAFPDPYPGCGELGISVDITGNADSAEIRIYTVAGRLIRKINSAGPLYPGRNIIRINNTELRGLASGTYYYEIRVISGSKIISRKSVFLILNKGK